MTSTPKPWWTGRSDTEVKHTPHTESKGEKEETIFISTLGGTQSKIKPPHTQHIQSTPTAHFIAAPAPLEIMASNPRWSQLMRCQMQHQALWRSKISPSSSPRKDQKKHSNGPWGASQHHTPSSAPVDGKHCEAGGEQDAQRSGETGRQLPFLHLMTCKSASIFILTKWSSATWFWQTLALPRLHRRPNSCSISCSCAENYRAGGTEPEEALALCRVHWQTAKMASAVLDFATFPKQSKLRTGTAIKVEELVSSEHSHGGGTGAEPSIQGISSGSLFQAWRYSERICSSLKWLHGWPTSMNFTRKMKEG